MRAVVALAAGMVLALGCTAPNELYGRDEGHPADLSLAPPRPDAAVVPVDAAQGLSCQELLGLVTAELANSTACRVDADCTAVQTACGLPGACGEVYANTGWRTDDVERQLKSWAAQACGPKTCPCPDRPSAPPACNDGACGPKKSGGGNIGAACASAADCLSGQCLTEAEDRTFSDGYCTIKACNDLVKCPTGSTCRGVSNGRRICLADCKMKADCRKGYNCCSGLGTGGGWCAPDFSSLCLGL